MPPRWREQYDRMKRRHARIAEATVVDDRHLDDFEAFFVCCFHLKDWLKADRSVNNAVKRAAEELVNTHEWLRLCADLANGSKHLILKTWRTDGMAHLDKTTWVVIAPDALPSDENEERSGRGIDYLEVPVVRGSRGERLAPTVANECIAAWEAFLRGHGLLGDAPPAKTDQRLGPYTGMSRQ